MSMMYTAMPTLPVSDLRNKQAEVVKQLDTTPILLTRAGHGAGVSRPPFIGMNTRGFPFTRRSSE